VKNVSSGWSVNTKKSHDLKDLILVVISILTFVKHSRLAF